MSAEIERMQPNMKALEKFDEIQDRLRQEEEALEKTKELALKAAEDFEDIRMKRFLVSILQNLMHGVKKLFFVFFFLTILYQIRSFHESIRSHINMY